MVVEKAAAPEAEQRGSLREPLVDLVGDVEAVPGGMRAAGSHIVINNVDTLSQFRHYKARSTA